MFALNSPSSSPKYDASKCQGKTVVARVVSPPGAIGDEHLGQWVHLAVQFDNGTVTMTVDGKIVVK